MHCHFYALPADLQIIFELVEASTPLRYTPQALQSSGTPVSFLSGRDLPTLGLPPPGDAAISGHSYLVTLREVVPRGRVIDLAGGGLSHTHDQLMNPDSMELLPGARHESGVLLYGRIATASDTAVSKQLFGLFKRAIGKKFRKVKAFWVGPMAEDAWKQGARLTIGLSSPREYDLRDQRSGPD